MTTTGITHIRIKTTLPGGLQQLPEWPSGRTFKGTTSDFALQPGGGVTVFLTNKVGVRFGVDYRVIFDLADEDNSTKEVRVASGFTLQWGGGNTAL